MNEEIVNFSPKSLERIPETTLFLDLGSNLGWAAYNPKTKIFAHGHEKMTKLKDMGGGPRLHRFALWLAEKHASWRFEQIVYEEVIGQYKSGKAAISMHGFLGQLELFNYLYPELNELKVINNGTLKKYLTPKDFLRQYAQEKKPNGKYLENKDFMIKKIQLLGFKEVVKSDEADAIALAIVYCLHKIIDETI